MYYIKEINKQTGRVVIGDMINGESDQEITINELKDIPNNIRIIGVNLVDYSNSKSVSSILTDFLQLYDIECSLAKNKLYFRSIFLPKVAAVYHCEFNYDELTDLYYINLNDATVLQQIFLNP